MTKNLLLATTWLCLFICGSLTLNAQKPVQATGYEINLKSSPSPYYFTNNQRVDQNTNRPINQFGLQVPTTGNDPESRAKSFLTQQQHDFGLTSEDIQSLQLHAVRTSPSGTVVRLRQYKYGVPVNKAEITINLNQQNEVTYVASSFQYEVNISNPIPSISLDQSKAIAYAHLDLNANTTIRHESNELFVFHQGQKSQLAYRVRVISDAFIGEWEVLVNAHTGTIFSAKDIAFYYCAAHDENHPPHSSEESIAATGDGNVFDPDPLSSGMVAYGVGGYVDNNDANSADLTSQTFNVPLLDITLTGGQYYLEGPYAEIVDFEAPNNGLFNQASSSFAFQRNDDAFEAVNVYYHIDASMRYINTVLNCAVMPYQYATGVRVDPSAANGADNSYYSTGSGALAFGEGCVDDAEDSDVIHHELGHGLHDWITSGGLSQVDGLSEGCGDYWAQSYNRSLGNWGPGDAAYNYVFNWDGHNACWGGRTTGYGASYPGGLVNQIHTDGQIWSTCLMTIYDIIGRAQTDKIFLEGLGMTNNNSSQNDAANAAYQAAINMGYSNADLTTIHTQFTSCGYTLPPLAGPPIADFNADLTSLCLDQGQNTVNFSDASTGAGITAWSWTFQGGTPASSTATNPTVTYSTPGTYQVTLTVTNSFGMDTKTEVGYITVFTGMACPSCTTTPSTNVPLTISASGEPTITSTIDITDIGEITDINIPSISITHTWISDLTITLTSPAGTVVNLTSGICDQDDNMDLGFDDGAATGTIPCPPTNGNLYIPTGSLASFNGENVYGTWTLTVSDGANQDGGSLDGWSLEYCTQCAVPTAIPTTVGVYDADYECEDAMGWTHYVDDNGTPDPVDDLLLLSINKGTSGVDIPTNQVQIGVTGVGGSVDLTGVAYVAPYEKWFVMNRYWNVSPLVQPSAGGVDLRFYYTTADYTGVETAANYAQTFISSHADLTFYKFSTGSGIDPDPTQGHTGGNNSNYIQLSPTTQSFNSDHYAEFNVASFSGGGGGGIGCDAFPCNPLPIELINFEAARQNNNILVKWQTETELNNAFFELEKSSDGLRFSSIAQVEGAGTTDVPQNYQHLDKNPLTGFNYYRLKQVDFDGRVSYSEVIYVNFITKGEVNIFPNPVLDEMTISYYSEASQDAMIRIYDVIGQNVSYMVQEANIGLNEIGFKTDFSPGVYFIALTVDNKTTTTRFVKVMH